VILFLASLVITGCGVDVTVDETRPSRPSPLGEHFDPAKTGTLRVSVAWKGALPKVEPFLSFATPIKEPPHENAQYWPNPFAPAVDPRSKGVAEVAVILRGIDHELSKPWDIPAARVEMKDLAMNVLQGKATSKVGFVRRGENLEMVSLDPAHYALQARGDAFFTYHFPFAEQPRTRTLDTCGRVELNGGLGRFWMRSTLYVVEHPYVAQTDAGGSAVLEQVPEGEYQLVLCHPRWQVMKVEHDPNWGQAIRLVFHPPLEVTRYVRIRRGETETIDETFFEARFAP
jgi:hypothetical protein